MKIHILAMTALALGVSAMVMAPAVLAQSTAVAAPAGVSADSLAAKYQADGYSRIEIKVGPSQAKVEAFKGDVKLEETYDLASGRIIKSETYYPVSGQTPSPGVFVRTLDDNPGRGRDDDSGHHSDDDHGDDDHGGRNRGSDDHGSDDYGGHGSDDSDHHGGDDSGHH